MFSNGFHILLGCAAVIFCISIVWKMTEPKNEIDVIDSNMILKKAKHIMCETLNYFWEDQCPKAPETWFERHILGKFRMLFYKEN